MNVGDAIGGLIALLVANADAVNAHLAGTGYTVKTDPGTAAWDASPYRYIKRGDRAKLPDGLTVCFVADSDRITDRLGYGVIERTASIQIVAYLVNERDPDGREAARFAVADALRRLFNTVPARTMDTAGGTFYDCELGDAQYRYGERLAEAKFGIVAAAVQMPWTAKYFVQETNTDA